MLIAVVTNFMSCLCHTLYYGRIFFCLGPYEEEGTFSAILLEGCQNTVFIFSGTVIKGQGNHGLGSVHIALGDLMALLRLFLSGAFPLCYHSD